MTDDKPETLLKSALEKIVYFEARASQLSNDAESTRVELERAKADLAAASQREIELRRVIAELEVRATNAHTEREEMARLNDALRRERAELIGRMLEASRISGIGEQSLDGLDLSGFIAQLLSEVQQQRGEVSTALSNPKSTVTEVANELKNQGRLQVTQNDLATLTGAHDFPGRSEETLFGFSVRELSALDASARVRAAERLEALRHPAAAPALATALHGEIEPRVQVALLSALSSLAKAEAAAVVKPLLTSPAAEVRVAALKALMKVDAPSAGPHLAQAMKDPDKSVRRRASLLALSLAGDEALRLGADAIRDDSADVRALAALVLGASNAQAARPMLMEAMRDGDERVRRSASQSLSRLLGRDVTQLVALDDAHRRREVRKLHTLPAVLPLPAKRGEGRGEGPVGASQAPLLASLRVAGGGNAMGATQARRVVVGGNAARTVVVERAAAQAPLLASPRFAGGGNALCEGVVRELRAAIRGRALNELSAGLDATSDDVMRACGELLSTGQIVRRGHKYFVA